MARGPFRLTPRALPDLISTTTAAASLKPLACVSRLSALRLKSLELILQNCLRLQLIAFFSRAMPAVGYELRPWVEFRVDLFFLTRNSELGPRNCFSGALRFAGRQSPNSPASSSSRSKMPCNCQSSPEAYDSEPQSDVPCHQIGRASCR